MSPPSTAAGRPRLIDEMPRQDRAAIVGVLTDIDDTVTTEGRLTAEAYGALERLKDAGLLVVPVTGRPAGWADHFARMWPVDGVVAENGALYLRYHDRRMIKRTVLDDDAAMAAYRKRLGALGAEILRRVPGTALASDQAYREFDLAIDFCEDVPSLPREDVDRIVAIFEEHGATAKVSSIHVNGWFGSWDKLSMIQRMLRDEHGWDVDDPAARRRFVFAGDSPNDQPMFGFFEQSVGVANIDEFADRWTTWPTWRTRSRCGAGFVELADALLSAR